LARSSDPTAALQQIAQRQQVYERHLAELHSATVADAPILALLARDAEIFRTEAHLRWLGHAASAFARLRELSGRPDSPAHASPRQRSPSVASG
jgi:hypothetical protein